MESLLCPWDAPTYFIFSSNVPTLLFYSHFTAVIASLLIGVFVYFKNRKDLAANLLALLFIIFSIWAILDVVLWASNRSDFVLFLWSMQVLFEPLIFALALYLYYTFIHNSLPGFLANLFVAIVVLPLILLTPSHLTLSGINLYDCNAVEGPLALYYTYVLQIFFIIGIVYIAFKSQFEARDRKEKRKILYFGIGLITFLIAFASGNIIGSVTGDWVRAQYGLFGMPVFVGFLAYLIVEYKIYNLTILGAQALIITLCFLIGSLLFVAQSTPTRIIATFTLIAAVILGIILIRSIKRSVKQKEQIEQLAVGLEKANDQLKVLDKMKSEFVSIASHQLRSPLTSIRGYSSMLLEGSFGPLPPKAKDAIDRINESSRFMASSIEDYLNVSRIQAGNMKYEYSDFNVCDLASRVADDTRPVALKKGLLLTFKSDMHKKGIVHADIGKTRQVIDNLINNSLKYTPKGSINILVHDDVKLKKVFIDVSDTGIGMNPHTLESMFGKFERASNANEVNVTGTGLGLYIARKMAREMGGDVYATSEGEGKGSTFTVELPLMM
jgi:signal transduction histidine kinase